MKSGIGQRREAARAEGGAAYAERRAEIIEAAAQVFRDKGFRGTSLADVAHSLGTDRATLYYYIGSKEEAFHEIVRAAAESNAARAEAILAEPGRAADKVRLLITALMASYADHPYLLVYIQEDLSRVSDGRSRWSQEMRHINKRYDDAVVGLIQSGVDEGSIRNVGSVRLMANAIIGMVNWSHRWFHPGTGSAPSAAEVGEAFADVILKGIRTRGRTAASASNGKRR